MTLHQESGDAPAAKTNAAMRLLQLFNALSQGPNGATWIAFAKALGLPYKHDGEAAQIAVATAIPMLIRDLESIKARLTGKYGSAPYLLDDPIRAFQQVLIGCLQNLSSEFGNERQKFRPDMMKSMAFWAHELPLDEPVLDSSALNSLRADLTKARDEIMRDASLDDAFKSVMLDLIDQLERALAAFAIGGIKEVREALRSYWVSAMAAASEIKRHQEAQSVKKGMNALKNAWRTARAAVELRDVLELGRDIAEKTDDAATALLELIP